jgi:hypothetical protein
VIGVLSRRSDSCLLVAEPNTRQLLRRYLAPWISVTRARTLARRR